MSAHTFGVNTWSRGRPSFGMGEPPPNDNTGGQVLLFNDEKDWFGPFRRVISHAGWAQFLRDMDARDWRLAIEESRLVDR